MIRLEFIYKYNACIARYMDMYPHHNFSTAIYIPFAGFDDVFFSGLFIDNSGEGAGALVGRVGTVKIVTAPFEDETGGGGGAGSRGDGGKEEGGDNTAASDEERKEAELEKRRQERAAQIEEK